MEKMVNIRLQKNIKTKGRGNVRRFRKKLELVALNAMKMKENRKIAWCKVRCICEEERENERSREVR